MNYYFIISVSFQPGKNRRDYEDYIGMVRPIVETYGGAYVVRDEKIEYLGNSWHPDRVIVIRFPDRESIDRCFSSEEYKQIMSKRTDTVESQAIIVSGVE